MRSEEKPLLPPQIKDLMYILGFIIGIVATYYGTTTQIALLTQKVDNFISTYNATVLRIDVLEREERQNELDIIKIKNKLEIPY